MNPSLYLMMKVLELTKFLRKKLDTDEDLPIVFFATHFLLAAGFLNFQKNSDETYCLDPLYSVSLPGYTYECNLYRSNKMWNTFEIKIYII